MNPVEYRSHFSHPAPLAPSDPSDLQTRVSQIFQETQENRATSSETSSLAPLIPPEPPHQLLRKEILLFSHHPWRNRDEKIIPSQILSKFEQFRDFLSHPYRKISALSELLDCIEGSIKGRHPLEMDPFLSSLQEKATQLWDSYMAELSTTSQKYLVLDSFLDCFDRRAIQRFVGQDDFFPLVQEIPAHKKIFYLERLMICKSPKIRPPLEFLSYLQSDKLLRGPAFPSIWQKALTDFFSPLPTHEILSLAHQYPDYFTEWSSVDFREDLFELFILEILKKDTLDSCVTALHFLQKKDSSPFVEEKIGQAYRKLKQLPFSFKMIELLLKNKCGPIHPEERGFMQHLRRFLPDLNRALLSYELLQRETDRMDISSFPRVQLDVGGKTLEAYSISGRRFRFLVHAAGLQEGPIENVKKNRIKSGFLCTSLIGNELSYFYHPKSSYAMVLSVDPRNIVATTNRDAYTPYLETKRVKEFYRLFERLPFLTAFIDQLYRESGIQGKKTTDDFSRMGRALSAEMLHPDVELEKLLEDLRSEITTPSDTGSYDQYHKSYEQDGICLLKVRTLLRFYSRHPEQATPEILSQLQYSRIFLMALHEEAHKNIHPIQGVEELLLQTPCQPPHLDNEWGLNPFNEVNLQLETSYRPGRDPIEVKAILIDGDAWNANRAAFQSVLLNAAANNLPILIKQEKERSPYRILKELKQHAQQGNWEEFRTLFERESLSDVQAGNALILACSKGKEAFAAQLLNYRPNISDIKIKRAFWAAQSSYETLQVLFSARREMLQGAVLQTLEDRDEPTYFDVIQLLLAHQIPIPPAAAGKAVLLALEVREEALALEIYRNCKNMDAADEKNIFSNAILWGRNSLALPILKEHPEYAHFSLETAAKSANIPFLNHILATYPFSKTDLENALSTAQSFYSDEVAKIIQARIF